MCVLHIARLLFTSLLFFFFKQKTAYEMRISDWSSDVCSSDLRRRGTRRWLRHCGRHDPSGTAHADRDCGASGGFPGRSEERRVGKECVVRVDLGGRRIIKKKMKTNDSRRDTAQ